MKVIKHLVVLPLRLFLFPSLFVYIKSRTREHLEMIWQVRGVVADILAQSTITSRVAGCSHVVFVMERKLFVFCGTGPEAKEQTSRMMMKLKKLLLFTG